MKQNQKLDHVYFIQLQLPSHSAEAKMRVLKQAEKKQDEKTQRKSRNLCININQYLFKCSFSLGTWKGDLEVTYAVTFSGQLHFRGSYFLRAINTSYFFGAAITSEQLLFRSCYFFKAVASYKQLFFHEDYLFGAELLPSSYFVEQIVLQGSQFFRTADFSEEKLVQNKDNYRRAAFSNRVLLRNIKIFGTAAFSTKPYLLINCFFRTASFSEKQQNAASTFLRELLLQSGHLLKRTTNHFSAVGLAMAY